MAKVIVYFHGYRAKIQSDKVDRLRKHFENVYAFNIDQDPDVSIPELTRQIDHMLVDHLHDKNFELIFIGTSLGGWYAAVLGHIYKCRHILINPCRLPQLHLLKLGVPEDICTHYCNYEASFLDAELFVAVNDEVLDFSPYMPLFQHLNAKLYQNADHRFNGPEFDDVIASI